MSPAYPGAIPPPAWQTATIGADAYTIGYRVVVVDWTLWSVAFAVVCTRFAVRVRLLRSKWGTDDYFILIAVILALGRPICHTIMYDQYGLGRHLWDVPVTWLKKHLSLLYTGDIIYTVSMMFTKLSILIYLYKLFSVERHFGLWCISMMVVVVCYCNVFFWIALLRCSPVAETWDPFNIMKPGVTCITTEHTSIAQGALNIATDAIILVMPIPIVVQMHRPWSQKIGLSLVFSIGTFVLAAAIVREVIVVRTQKEIDQTYTEVSEVIWLSVELMVGIICVALPITYAMWHRLFIISRNSSLISLIRRSSNKNTSMPARDHTADGEQTPASSETRLESYAMEKQRIDSTV